MFYVDFIGFTNDPFIWVITLHNRKTLFFVFLSYSKLNEVKQTWDFMRINISSRKAHGAWELRERSLRAKWA
jgi:hypothetical protein